MFIYTVKLLNPRKVRKVENKLVKSLHIFIRITGHGVNEIFA